MSHRCVGKFVSGLSVSLLMLCSVQVNATVVEFRTVLGDFQVNLFDQTTPATVSNFLDYVNNGHYTDTVIHRSEPGFVIQGGGFNYSGALPLGNVLQNPAVTNEPQLSNVRGTIAMAKLASDPNSATNQWFFNLVDNSADLDGSNGGFTVFGIVMGDGMDVVDAIAALDRFNFNSPLDTLPLQNYTADDANNGVEPDDTNLMLINEIVVIDSTVNTGASLLPPANITITPPTTPTTPTLSGGGGGSGALSFWILLSLLGFVRYRTMTQR